MKATDLRITANCIYYLGKIDENWWILDDLLRPITRASKVMVATSQPALFKTLLISTLQTHLANRTRPLPD